MTARSSPLARTVDLGPSRSAAHGQVAARFHPSYGPALARLPSGRRVFHGLPFDLGPEAGTEAGRWILVAAPLTIDLPEGGPASHVVVAHLCDAWRDDAGRRPAGLAVGHVVPVGEPLARYTVVERSGRETTRIVRRRFEIDDGILGWGSAPFAAIPHVANEVLDWRGPHAAQGTGRYAPTGQSGSLTIMPGTYGGNQVGMSDFVPSPTDDALLWLHAIELPAGAEPVALRLEPLAGGRPGSDVIVAGGHAVRRLGRPARAQPALRGPDRRPRRPAAGGRPRDGHPDAAGRDPRRRSWRRPRDRRLGHAASGPDAPERRTERRRPLDRGGRDRPPRRLGGVRPRPPGRAADRPGRPAIDRGAAGAPRARSRSRSWTGPPASGCPAGSASRRPTGATCHRSAIATRSTRRSSRTPAATSSSGRAPTPTSRAGSRSTCRSVGSTSRSSAASTGSPTGPGSRSTRRPGAWSCRSTGRSTSTPAAGSPPTPTSTSSRRRPRCSRRRPRMSTSSTSWRPSGATCTRT